MSRPDTISTIPITNFYFHTELTEHAEKNNYLCSPARNASQCEAGRSVKISVPLNTKQLNSVRIYACLWVTV